MDDWRAGEEAVAIVSDRIKEFPEIDIMKGKVYVVLEVFFCPEHGLGLRVHPNQPCPCCGEMNSYWFEAYKFRKPIVVEDFAHDRKAEPVG